MKYISEISILTILICVLLTVQSSPLNIKSSLTFRHTRTKRSWFGRTTKTTPIPTTTLPPPNDYEIGECKEDDKVKKKLSYF